MQIHTRFSVELIDKVRDSEYFKTEEQIGELERAMLQDPKVTEIITKTLKEAFKNFEVEMFDFRVRIDK